MTDFKWSMAFLLSWSACLASWSAREISADAPAPPELLERWPVEPAGWCVTRFIGVVVWLRTWRLEVLEAVDFISSIRRLQFDTNHHQILNTNLGLNPKSTLFIFYFLKVIYWAGWLFSISLNVFNKSTKSRRLPQHGTLTDCICMWF